MKRLLSYMNEMAAVVVDDLDVDFLNRAQKVTSFNLQTADLETLINKTSQELASTLTQGGERL